MELKYKNYIIEKDRSCYVVREMWTIDEWRNKWNECEKDVHYPHSLEKALMLIFKKEKAKKIKSIELNDLIIELKKVQDEFIKDIKELLSK